VESAPSRLTRRELEVVRLMAQGLTNREIARRLFISERTVDGHLEHVREKLGVSTRAQIASWLVRQEANGQPAAVHPGEAPPRPQLRLVSNRVVWLAGAALLALVASGLVVLIMGPPANTSRTGPFVETTAGTEPVIPGPLGGYSGDGGLAIHAQLSRPSDVAIGADGTIYIADYGNQVVRALARDGSISTVAGGGQKTLTDGAFGKSVLLGYTSSLAVDSSGHFYLLTINGETLEVWTLRSDATLAFVFSLGRSSPGAKIFSLPTGGLAVSADGTMYVADRAGNRVWRRTVDGQVSVYAGTGNAGFSGDGGAANGAELHWPIGLSTDKEGDLYIADSANNRIRKVDPSGVITTIAGIGGLYGDSGDGGPARQAQLAFPFGVTVGKDGTLYLADTGNNRVREVTTSGRIVALAGNGQAGFSGDGAAAAEAQFSGPEGVVMDSKGDLFVADTGNQRLRELPGVSR
jgi:DNA-binding CsgD family transcriptional regulator